MHEYAPMLLSHTTCTIRSTYNYIQISRLHPSRDHRDPPSSPPGVTHQVVDNDDSAKRRLDNFFNNVTRKRDSPLIREPPKQPPTKPILPWWSRRLVAQSLSRVLASKRGEVLIMQRMGYTKGPSVPSASELEAFDRIFDGNLTVSEAEALNELFLAVGKAPSRQPRDTRPPPRSQSCVDIGCFLLCNIET
jgi:hypothetical protein